MRVGVIVFPGSNCDHDAWYAINENLHGQRRIHLARILESRRRRCGAFARWFFVWRLPALRRHRAFFACDEAVKKFAAEGGLVLGICNGFQILVEAGLLPGALLRNQDLKFICREAQAAH